MLPCFRYVTLSRQRSNPRKTACYRSTSDNSLGGIGTREGGATRRQETHNSGETNTFPKETPTKQAKKHDLPLRAETDLLTPITAVVGGGRQERVDVSTTPPQGTSSFTHGPHR